MRNVELTPLDESPRWFFNQCLDLEHWLPAITNHEGEGQDNDGALVAAFHAEHAPCAKHGLMMAASREMYLLLTAGLPLLRRAAVENEDQDLRTRCDEVAQRLREIDAAQGTQGPDRAAW